MKTENPQLMKCFLNKGLVLLDKEMKVFLSNKKAEGKNTRT